MFFQDKDGLRAKHGEIKDAGAGGWKEVTRGKSDQMMSINCESSSPSNLK